MRRFGFQPPPPLIAIWTPTVLLAGFIAAPKLIQIGQPVFAGCFAAVSVAATLTWFRCRAAAIVLMTFLVLVAGIRCIAVARNGMTLGDAAGLAAIAWVLKHLFRWQADLNGPYGRDDVGDYSG